MADATIYDPPRRIRGWTVQVTCPECGHLLEHVADGRPEPRVSRARARCTSCRHEFLVEIRLDNVTIALDTSRTRVGRRVP